MRPSLLVLLLVAAVALVPGARAEGVPCPTDVRAEATPDGHTTITWTLPEGASFDRIQVERFFSLTGFRVVANLEGDATAFEVDLDLEQLQVFRIIGIADGVRCLGPETADVVVIPDLPGAALGFAAVGGLLGYALLRRR